MTVTPHMQLIADNQDALCSAMYRCHLCLNLLFLSLLFSAVWENYHCLILTHVKCLNALELEN